MSMQTENERVGGDEIDGDDADAYGCDGDDHDDSDDDYDDDGDDDGDGDDDRAW